MRERAIKRNKKIIKYFMI